MLGPLSPTTTTLLRRAVVPYLGALGATGAALLLRGAMAPWLGPTLPLATLYGAVALAVWWGGYGPALLAAVLGYLGATFFFGEPFSAYRFSAPALAGALAYLASCAAIIGLGEAMRRARARAEGSEARFRRIVETAHEGIWLLDAEARVSFVNQRMADMVGLEPAQMLGRPKWDFLLGRDRERVRELFGRRRAGVAEQLDLCFEHRDGRPVWMLMAAQPLFDQSGVFQGTLDMFTDVTERKHLEAQLQQRLEQVAALDRRKDDFIATLSHELRNPLAPIRNAVALLDGVEPGPDLDSIRSLLDRQVGQLTRLIDDLLDATRFSRGRLEIRRERVELGAIVASAVETSRPRLELSDQELRMELPEEPIVLHADPIRLAQVFNNLLDNAAKFSRRGGRIALSASRQGSEVVVRIRDDGIGIDPEQLPRVFEMFAQEESALERSRGGLGIGLALVRGFVELHGGRVEAHSEGRGKGSEFVVRLPLAPEAVRPAPPSEPGATEAPTRGRRVLVVDDNRDAAESLVRLLERRGHEVRAAHDGPGALAAGEAFRPEAVLLDIGLPGMNGYEVASRMRAQPWSAGTLLVAVTGWGQASDKERAASAGIDHHLTKPVDFGVLQELLEKAGG
jgi:PAS domain S-box-containing protein